MSGKGGDDGQPAGEMAVGGLMGILDVCTNGFAGAGKWDKETLFSILGQPNYEDGSFLAYYPVDKSIEPNYTRLDGNKSLAGYSFDPKGRAIRSTSTGELAKGLAIADFLAKENRMYLSDSHAAAFESDAVAFDLDGGNLVATAYDEIVGKYGEPTTVVYLDRTKRGDLIVMDWLISDSDGCEIEAHLLNREGMGMEIVTMSVFRDGQ